MKSRPISLRITVIAASAIVGTLSLFAATGIASHWKDREYRTDGSPADWPVLDLVGDDISVAAANDDRELYLAIATSDAQRRRQLLLTGVIIWLDPNGGKKEGYGIRIPGAGLQPGAGRGRAGRFGGAPPQENSAGTSDIALPPLTSIELIGPGKDDRRRLELSAVPEIGAAVGLHEGTLLYELRLPLAGRSDAQPYGIGAKLDRALGLGIETPRLERPEGAIGGRGGDGRRGGGFRRGGGGFGDPGGRGSDAGMRGRGGVSQLKAVKIWTSLTLARRAG